MNPTGSSKSVGFFVLSRCVEMCSNVGVVTEKVGCSVLLLPRRSEIPRKMCVATKRTCMLSEHSETSFNLCFWKSFLEIEKLRYLLFFACGQKVY